MALKGKNAIVTGSTSGIGLGVAVTLAKEGVNILLNGFGTPEEIDAAKKAVAATGVKVDYSNADMSKPEQIAAMVAQGEKAFGAVDILVNNAGIQFTSPIEAFPTEKWDAIIAINLSAVFHGTKAALPGMQSRGWGRIINIASVHGLVASANKSAYVAAKHGVIGLTKVTALENAGKGITCNAICPGWVLTPLVQKQIDAIAAKDGISNAEASVKLLSEKQPSKAFVTPEQLGALAVFLCGDAAAQQTGSAINMDGGWIAQ
jgi:3-hydroxybutyrate dehydrogenase